MGKLNHSRVAPLQKLIDDGILSRSTAYRLANAGQIAGCRKIGDKWLIDMDVFYNHFKESA